MGRSTVTFEDGLHDQLKALSQEWHTSLKEAVNQIVRVGLANIRKNQKPKPVKIPVHDTGPRPGVDISDRNSLYDLIEDEQWL